MRRLRHFLDRVRASQAWERLRLTDSASRQLFSARFEPLEQRQLLSADMLLLASLDSSLLSPGDTKAMQLDVADGQAILGFRMHGLNGTLDPDSVVIEDLSGHTIAPVLANANSNGTNDSLVLAELGPGSYSVTCRAEGATTGNFNIEVFLPGDSANPTIGNIAGQVEPNELLWTQAAAVQSHGTWTHVTQLYFAQYGIDLSQDLYQQEFDCDGDGDVDNYDLSVVSANANARVTIDLTADSEAPIIQADLTNDTGSSETDGISQDVTIGGSVQDESEVVELLAAVDQGAYESILVHVDESGSFQLDIDQLQDIAGDSNVLANSGQHTLSLIATDEYGNESAAYEVSFELDTIAPAAPTALDMIAASDLGFHNDDNVTSDNTPTFTVDGEAGTTLSLYSDVDGLLGQALANSPVSITASAMSDGLHEISALAEDVAGNQSISSGLVLDVTVDTVAPVAPTLDLATADDTGTIGDQTTEKTSVRLEGSAEAGSRVTLDGTTTINADATTGEFGYDAINLHFRANEFIVVSMDLAGNTSSFTQTITQNNMPTNGTPVGPIALDEDPGDHSYSLATLFDDLNLGDGDELTLSIVGNTNAALVTPTLSGTSGQIINSQLNLTFGANKNGTALLTIRATDSYGKTVDAQIEINITPVNDAPTTQPTNIPINENATVTIDLHTIVNDVETIDKSLLTFEVTGMENGTATLKADGHTVEFKADTDFAGPASFTYKVTDTGDGDGTGAGAPTFSIGTVNYTVNAVNDPPTANPGSGATKEDTPVMIDLWGFVDDHETPKAELTFVVTDGANGTATLQEDGHTVVFEPALNFNNLQGTANFTYTVTDKGDRGADPITSGPATVTVSVTAVNDAPTTQPTNIPINENATVTIDLHTIVNDVETVNKNQLYFEVTGMENGTATLKADGHTVEFKTDTDFAGPASFTYKVTDTGDGDGTGDGAPTFSIGTVNYTVNAVNDPPTANPGSDSTNEDIPVTIDLWDFVDDHETPKAELTFVVTDGANGTATLQEDGHKVVFEPALDFNGTANFTYTVTDKGDRGAAPITSGPATVTVSVAAINDAPTATEDSYTVTINGQLDVDPPGVLGNDDDVDEDTLTAVLVKDVEHGTLIFNPTNGSFSYTPGLDFTGIDTFTYKASDGTLESTETTVTINVTENILPEAGDDDIGQTNEDTEVSGGGLLNNDGDADGDPIEVVDFDGESVKGAAVTVDANGNYTYDPRVSGQLQSLPEGESTTDTFTYTIDDGRGGQATAQVTIKVFGKNDKPTAENKTTETNENSPVTEGYLLVNATDPDLSDTLSVDTVESDSESEKGAQIIYTASGSFTYNPGNVFDYLADGQPATDTFNYVIKDSYGVTATATVTVTIHGKNDDPDALNDLFEINQDQSIAVGANHNVLGNDEDPDDGATIEVTSHDAYSAKNVPITVNADGTFSYDPGDMFQYLGADIIETDSFSYTITDEHGIEDTAIVTIKITGLNDAPDAVDDDEISTPKNTPIPIDVVDNDTDPDDGDTPVVYSYDFESHLNATISLNGDGTLKYDPTTSPTLSALAEGHEETDYFYYRVTDGNGGFDEAKVTVTVSGTGNSAPEVDVQIEDKTLTDSSSPQPGLIDLLDFFSDPDNDSLIFSAWSDNDTLVAVEIVNDHYLKVTYLPYDTDQDRTPADITVRATEDKPSALYAEETFKVTVKPEETVGVYLVVRETATDEDDTHVDSLPNSIGTVAVGSTYVVEIWLQDTWDSSVTGGPTSGLTGAELDLLFNPGLSQAEPLTSDNYDGQFYINSTHGGTVDNVNGVIDDFEAGTEAGGIAITPKFARLGYVTFEATTEGVQNFTFDDLDVQVARWGENYVDLSQINLGTAMVNQVDEIETLTFDLSESNLFIDGMINGATLTSEPPQAASADGVLGTLEVIVDNLNNPTAIQIESGSMDVLANYGDGPFRPGPGGTDSDAFGDFAFSAQPSVNELIEMAIRDITFEFESGLLSISGKHFLGHQVAWDITSGSLDVLSPSMGSNGYNMTELEIVPIDEEMGTYLYQSSLGSYQISIPYERTIDISGLSPSIQEGSYLRIMGTILATHDPSAAIMGTETGDEGDTGTGVYMTLSQDPTLVPTGQVATLPGSEAWIDEWDSYWVEIWAKTDQADGVAAAKVDLQYNAEYFTATQIDHGSAFIQDASGELGTDGLILGLGGTTTLTGLGHNGYTLLGRVKFESLGDNGVDINPDDLTIVPHELGLGLDNVVVELVGQGTAEASVRATPKTELWAVPYDVDDDGEIGLGDLSYFAAAYGSDSIEADTAFSASLDFDHDGEVALGDLSYLACNYGLARGGVKEITFSDSFTQRWIGAGIEAEGDATVGQLLDLAVKTWQDALGLAEPIEIQLVVQDYDSAQLAEAIILEVDETGVPTSGRVVIDCDANGLGWSTQLDGELSEEQYDLYTVLLHEIGHTLGFVSTYDGFAEHLESTDGSIVFVANGISAEMDTAGNHVAGEAMADDLMSSTLSPGVRKSISNLDVQMLHAAHQTASNGANGYSRGGAAIMGATLETVETLPMLTTSATTSDLDTIDERLEGDVTWERLLSSTKVSLETVSATDWLYMHDDDASLQAQSSSLQSGADEQVSDELFFELAANQDSRSEEEDAADSLLVDWDMYF